MPDLLTIKLRNANGVPVIVVSGELDLASAGTLAAELENSTGPLVVVDLAELSFMDSSGISCLVVAKANMDEVGRTLVLTRPQPRVERAMEVVGLADWLSPWSSDWAPSI